MTTPPLTTLPSKQEQLRGTVHSRVARLFPYFADVVEDVATRCDHVQRTGWAEEIRAAKDFHELARVLQRIISDVVYRRDLERRPHTREVLRQLERLATRLAGCTHHLLEISTELGARERG